MKLFTKQIPALAIGILLLQPATAQLSEAIKHIPEGCTQVMQVDLGYLQQLMKWEEFSHLSFVQSLKEKNNPPKDRPALVDILPNPSETGIDLGQQLYTFSRSHFGEGDFEYFNGVTGKIANLQQFTTWALKMNNTITLTKPGRVKTIVNKKAAYIWDTEYFTIVSDPINESGKLFNRFENGGKQEVKEPVFTRIAKTYEEGAIIPAIDARMASLFQQKAPVKVWNMKMKHGMAGVITDPAKIFSALIEGEQSVSASILNFENGRAFFTSRTWLDPELDKLISGNKTPFNTALAQHVQLDKIPGFLSLKLNLARLSEFLAMVPKKRKDGMDMGRLGINTSDMEAAFGGDLFVGLLRAGDKENLIKPGLIAAVTIKDATAFARVMDSIKATLNERLKNRIFYAVDAANKIFVAGSSQEDVDAFVKGSYPEQDKDLLAQITGNPFFMHIDITKLYKELMLLEEPVSEKDKMFSSMLNGLQNFSATAGKYENGTLLLDYELGFVNKEDNGYRQMILMYDKLLTGMMQSGKPAEGDTLTMPVEVIRDPETIRNVKEETKTETLPQELAEALLAEPAKTASPKGVYKGKGPGNSRTIKTKRTKTKKH